MRIDQTLFPKRAAKPSPLMLSIWKDRLHLSKALVALVPPNYNIAFEYDEKKKILYLVESAAPPPKAFKINSPITHEGKYIRGSVRWKGLGEKLISLLGLTFEKTDKYQFLVGSEGMIVEGDYYEIWYEIISKPIQ